MRMALVVWKYSTEDSGEQFVIILGVLMMRQLHVVSLDMTMLLEHFEEDRFLQVLDRYG